MAADFLDNAVELQAALNDTALQHQLSKNRFHIKSLTHCKDCGFDIEQERQALGGVERCTECEGFHQRELFQKKQRAM
jgi:RNA polymerase-binding transcription factor DksA